MKSFKLSTEILIIFCVLIVSGVSALEKRIGSDGREYLIEFDYKYNWFQAMHECARRNRQLLTIDSAEKQNVINKLLTDEPIVHLWLGANDEFKSTGNVDRPFYWSATGKQFTYFNWHNHHPLKGDANQHCVLVWTPNKEWLNYECDDKSGFVCEEKYHNASDIVQQLTKDFDLKFLRLLENKLTNITQTAVQKILNKQERSTKELNREITKQ